MEVRIYQNLSLHSPLYGLDSTEGARLPKSPRIYLRGYSAQIFEQEISMGIVRLPGSESWKDCIEK
jgi:hypothetical protein